jgi:hypothetical protein
VRRFAQGQGRGAFAGCRRSAPSQPPEDHEHDPIEDIVPMMPIVLPVGGAVLIFLLAFIAVSMA